MWLGFFPQFSFSLCSASLQGDSECSVAGWPANASQKHTAYANSTNHPTQSGLSLSLTRSLFSSASLSFSATQRWQGALRCHSLRWTVPRPVLLTAKALVTGCVMGKSVCACVCELVQEVSRVEGGVLCWGALWCFQEEKGGLLFTYPFNSGSFGEGCWSRRT